MARQSKGRLFQRGKQKRFYLQYYVNGKQFCVALRDPDGNPITDRRKAEFAAADIMNPIQAANKADQLRKVREAVEDAETKAERLAAEEAERQKIDEERSQNAKATISDGWQIFMTCPKRPTSCKRFPADQIPRHTTAANYRSYYERFSAWIRTADRDAILLSDITPETAAAFMDQIRQESASGTYNKYLQFFNCFFDVLRQAGKISAENPFRDIDRAEHHYNSKRPLSMEQIRKLIDTADGEIKILLLLGYYTGLRFGDCCTLLWNEIDLNRGVIERIPRKTMHTVKDQQEAKVKIGLSPELKAMLLAIPEDARKGFLLPESAEKYLAKKDTKINEKILKHFAECGIETHRAGTGIKTVKDPETGEVRKEGSRAVVEIGFHSLRYSYISHNAERGTPAAVIQKNAGHASPAMTEHYTRISDEAAVRYAAVLQLNDPDNKKAGEPERTELHTLADTLPIETIRKILKKYQG